MRYGCIGEVLGHSFSAAIHARLTKEPYELCEIPREELSAWMERRDFCGINVTIPYKQAVLPFLYELDEGARAIGAVNTVVNRSGRLYGYNTDFYGMTCLLEHIGIDPRGKKAVILGTGGTSLTAMAVLTHLGAREVLRVSRSGRDGAVTYEELYRDHADAELLINTTPVGMFPHAEGIPAELERLPRLQCVADAVYNPLRTNLILQARARGIPAAGGLLMLVAQAVRASEIFFDTAYSPGTVERITSEMLREKQNIVLIGMPGSGKSTVGRLLSEIYGRPLIDMDSALTDRLTKTPAEIIATEGESVFRDAETALLREELAALNGHIIATGGGAILRRENELLLRQNGRIYYLDRPWQSLIPTADRPLSGTVELIKKRYDERWQRYSEAADVRITDPQTADQAAELIGKDFDGNLI